MNNRTILHGDVLEKLKEIPEESIDCIITSPPYWGLRDYGADGQWGLESDFKQYLEKLRQMMNCLRVVLKKTGTCWVDLGDTYGCNDGKSRYGIPERFYIQCIDDGWIARNHIPWIKENSMPSSVKDRFTNKWESIFFFVKQQKYYFNLDGVRERPKTETKPFNIRVRENITGHAQAKLGDMSWTASEEELDTHNKLGEKKQDNVPSKNHNLYEGFNDRWKERKHSEQTIAREHFGMYNKEGNLLSNNWKKGFDENGNCYGCREHYSKHPRLKAPYNSVKETGMGHGSSCNCHSCSTRTFVPCNPKGKNPGDIFNINPRPFPEAHFATFPIDLPLKILKCACPENGTVLDPFFGAGTVGMAAERLGLNWIGIELKQEYIDIARKRLLPYQNERLIV